MSYYNLAGYKNEVEYDTSEIKTGYDPKMINKIAKGIRNKNNNRYLIPESYHGLLTDKLRFNDEHELLWGNEEEIENYAPQLFECLIRDCINENVEIKSQILSLISNFDRESTEITQEKIDRFLKISYDNKESVLKHFIKLYTDFTYNRMEITIETIEKMTNIKMRETRKKMKFIVTKKDTGVHHFTKENKSVTNLGDEKCLFFKKLDKNIEIFVRNVFSPFLTAVFISELSKAGES